MSAAWVIRSGRYGERDDWALSRGVSGGGWHEVPDLSAADDRAAVASVVEEVFAGEQPGARHSYTGQLWAVRGRIQVGDLLVLPLKTTRELALGRVTGGYRYLTDEDDPSKRHVVEVDWRNRVPRSAIKQDLLYTLGSAISVFQPSRNHAAARLEHVLSHGVDPGALGTTEPTPVLADQEGPADGDVDVPETKPNVAELALDQITTKIGEEFAGLGFQNLVTELLRAEGFDAEEAQAGADGGIDIIAGRGLLGLESPKLIVQVKTGQVGSEVVSQLQGLVTSHQADYGLLVTWAGLSRPARDAIRHQRFAIRVWDSTAVIDAVLRNYDRLPESITARIPLRRVWMLREDV